MMGRQLYIVNRPGIIMVTMGYGGSRKHPIDGQDVGTISVYVNNVESLVVYDNTDFYQNYVVEVKTDSSNLTAIASVALDLIFAGRVDTELLDATDIGDLRIIYNTRPTNAMRPWFSA